MIESPRNRIAYHGFAIARVRTEAAARREVRTEAPKTSLETRSGLVFLALFLIANLLDLVGRLTGTDLTTRDAVLSGLQILICLCLPLVALLVARSHLRSCDAEKVEPGAQPS